jgi:hypothetical protein
VWFVKIAESRPEEEISLRKAMELQNKQVKEAVELQHKQMHDHLARQDKQLSTILARQDAKFDELRKEINALVALIGDHTHQPTQGPLQEDTTVLDDASRH